MLKYRDRLRYNHKVEIDSSTFYHFPVPGGASSTFIFDYPPPPFVPLNGGPGDPKV